MQSETQRNKLVPLPVRRDAGSFVTGLTGAILVAMGQCTVAHSAFIISRGGDIPWPARSPDLSVCDCFLWAYLKSSVYLTKPHDIDKLKNTIKGEITATRWKKQWEPYVTDWSGAGDIVENTWEMCSLRSKIRNSSEVMYLNGILFPTVLYKK